MELFCVELFTNRPKISAINRFPGKEYKSCFRSPRATTSVPRNKTITRNLLSLVETECGSGGQSKQIVARIGGGQKAGPAIFFGFLKLHCDATERQHRVAFGSETKETKTKEITILLNALIEKENSVKRVREGNVK
jgi:hypothetical protein